MKILLYIFLGIVVLVALVFGGSIFYLKKYDKPISATSELAPATIFGDSIISILSTLGKEFREDTHLSLSATVNGENYHYGFVRDNDSLKMVDLENKVFEIGSITKVFTAYIIHVLVQEGVIELDDSILDHLPLQNEKLRRITIRSLLNHTSGLKRMPNNLKLAFQDDPYKEYNTSDLFEYLEQIDYIPKTAFQSDYSNLGYGILGAIIEHSTKSSVEANYQKWIFDSLLMDNSSFYLDSVRDVVLPGRGYMNQRSSYWNFGIMGSAGAIKSSSNQLLLFANMLIEGSKPVQELKKISFISDAGEEFGTGIFKSSNKSGDQIYWHNGATGGFNSCMAIDVDNKIAVVVLTNRNISASRNDHIDQICFKTLKYLRTNKSE